MSLASLRAPALLAAALLVGVPCAAGLCGSSPFLAPAAAQETRAEETGTLYHFGTFAARTTILFESETDVETIHGVTHSMTGTARFDWDAGTGKTGLTIPVADLKTGIDKRDEHLRSETWLDAARYPEITFAADSLKRKKDSDVWTYKGKLTIHGVTKDLEGEATVKKLPAAVGKALGPGEWVKVKTEFQVPLADFDIKVPDGPVQGKVSKVWDVRVDIFGTTEAPKEK